MRMNERQFLGHGHRRREVRLFAVVNSYTRAAQFKGLSAESSYKLQRVGGDVLGMLN